jgi:hypothetical protein
MSNENVWKPSDTAVYTKYLSAFQVPGIVAFWDFSEGRAPFCSKAGNGAFPLVNGAGSKVQKGTAGPLGSSIILNGTSDYLTLKADSVGALNIGKSGNNVTVIAWFKRTNSSATSAIAGMWVEDDAAPGRQYALFVDLPVYGGDNKVCFHVSKTGGNSPNLPYSRDYSANGTSENSNIGEFIAGSYDGAKAISYIEGRFESYTNYTEPGAPTGEGLTYDKNPYIFTLGLNNRDVEFTIGAVSTTSGYSNFAAGEIACVAVFNETLTQAQICAFQNSLISNAEGFKNRLFLWTQTSSGVGVLTGCNSYFGATATSQSASSTGVYVKTSTGSPLSSFVYRASTTPAGVGLFTCESMPDASITTENLYSLNLQIANANTADLLRICIKIDSLWYATATQYSVSNASASGSDWSLAEIKTVVFSKNAASWQDITLIPGTSLVLASAVRATNLPSGSITGWGVFTNTTPAGNVRFRNVEIVTL